MLCCVLLLFSIVNPSCTSTLTFVALRQLRCCSFWSEVNTERGVSPVFSVCNNFEGRKGSCCVVCCCCFLLSIHPVPVLYFSTTITVVQACLSCNDSDVKKYTNMSTLTFVALRQLRCRCLLNCLVLSTHNPARSVALRRRAPFLHKLITVTCKRFSTQQLSEPNHMSNCVGPA
jgi:hypothetical protein